MNACSELRAQGVEAVQALANASLHAVLHAVVENPSLEYPSLMNPSLMYPSLVYPRLVYPSLVSPSLMYAQAIGCRSAFRYADAQLSPGRGALTRA
jgi:hypothetical protein